MNNETLILLAKFTFQARKIVGALDSNMLISDESYRNNIFQKVDAEADEELLMLSMILREKLINPQHKSAAPTDDNKYKFGARG